MHVRPPTVLRPPLVALAFVAGLTTASAGPDPASARPAAGSGAMPSSLAMPARTLVWPTVGRLALWWQPAQPAPPSPTPADPAPAETGPAPAEPATAPGEGDAPSDAAVIAEAEAALEGQGEVIVVTGSAIERSETTTPAPVTVVDREELQAAGMASIGDVLQDLPVNGNAINTQANNGGDGATRINMRGLGERRTLVLLNGRRHVPGGTGADASVDLNSIPLAVIERIEVLKDGASAVYGSDAIAGVVNIITRTNFTGTEVNLYTATTQRGGGTTYDASFVTGTDAGKANIVVSAGFYDQADIFASDRSFSDPQRDMNFETGVEEPQGSLTTPQGTAHDRICGATENPRTDGCSPDLNGNGMPDPGELSVCDAATCFRDPTTGDWRPFRATGNYDTGTGDEYNFQPDNYLLTPQRRYNVWTTGNYKFREDLRGFFEASYVNRRSDQQLAPEPLDTLVEGIYVSPLSIYNPWGDHALGAGNGQSVFRVRKRMVEAGPRETMQDIDTFRIVTGFDGTLPEQLFEGWRYTASYNFGRTVGTVVNRGNLIRSRVAESIGPSYYDENNRPRCGTPDDPGTEGCIPLDLLGGEGSVKQDMVDWITYTGILRGYNRQHTLLGQLHGPLFKIPGGEDVVLAVGADYRYEAGGSRPDPLTATGDTTGVKADPTGGHYSVVEGFAEVSIVPVSNQAWAKWLEISAAARAVDYDTFGSNFSWKGGLLYKTPFGVAVRGTYSTAFRAPNVAELWGGAADDFPNVTDPCSFSRGPLTGNVAENCARDGIMTGARVGIEDDSSQYLARAGGNEDLRAETAKILTGGLVFEPTFDEGLAVTVDYFDVTIDDSIQRAGANILLSQCYASPPDQRSECDKIARDPDSHFLISIDDRTRNIGRVETSGIDAGIQYVYELKGIGRFRHDLEGTRLLAYNEFYPLGTSSAEIKKKGLGTYDLGVYPKWKGNLSTMWGLGGIGAGFNVRYIHSFKECRSADQSVQDDCSLPGALSRKVDPNVTADVLASFAFDTAAGKTTISGGVNNVLDQDPPDIYNGFLATSDSNTYDYIGRFFYLRVSQIF